MAGSFSYAILNLGDFKGLRARRRPSGVGNGDRAGPRSRRYFHADVVHGEHFESSGHTIERDRRRSHEMLALQQDVCSSGTAGGSKVHNRGAGRRQPRIHHPDGAIREASLRYAAIAQGDPIELAISSLDHRSQGFTDGRAVENNILQHRARGGCGKDHALVAAITALKRAPEIAVRCHENPAVQILRSGKRADRTILARGADLVQFAVDLEAKQFPARGLDQIAGRVIREVEIVQDFVRVALGCETENRIEG